MKAKNDLNATYRVALGTVPPFEVGDIVSLIDLSISDREFKDAEGNPVQYGKLLLHFANGATLSGSAFRGVHKTGTRKNDSVVIRSFLATAMAKAKAVATAKYPRPDKGKEDVQAKEFNTLAILTLLKELTQNPDLTENTEIEEIKLQVTAVFNCIGQTGDNSYEYTAYQLDLPE